MELPKFSGGGTTSMSSANVSAPRMSTPSGVRANTRTFRPERTASDVYKEKMQPTKLDQMLDIGSQVLEIAIKVDDANQDMALKAAEAEYKNHMANWNIDFQRTAMEQNEETGRPNWENYEEQFELASEQASALMRDKHKFGGKDRETEWSLNRKGADTSMRGNIVSFTTRAKTAEAEVKLEIAQKNASYLGELQGINQKAVEAGLITQDQAKESERVFLLNQNFRNTLLETRTAPVGELVKTRAEMLEGRSARAMEYGVDRQSALIKEIDLQIENRHRAQLKTIYDNGGGSMAMSMWVDALDKGGTEATGTLDMVQHDAMIQKLRTRIDRTVAAEKEMVMGTESRGMAVGYLSGSRMIGIIFNSKDHADDRSVNLAKEQVTGYTQQILESDGGLHSAEFQQVLLLGEHQNWRVSNATAALNQSLLSGGAKEVSDTVAMLSRLEKSGASHIENQLNAEAKKKYEFMRDAQEFGLYQGNTPEETLVATTEAYHNYASKTPTQLKQEGMMGSDAIEANGGILEVMSNGLQGQGIQLGGEFGGPDITADTKAQYAFRLHYENGYAMFGRHGVAQAYASRQLMKQYGMVSTGGDNYVFEKDAPQAILAGIGDVPANTTGQPVEFLEQQRYDMIDELNAARAKAKPPMSQIDPDNARYVHVKNGDRDEWLVIAMDEYGNEEYVGWPPSWRDEFHKKHWGEVPKELIGTDRYQQQFTKPIGETFSISYDTHDYEKAKAQEASLRATAILNIDDQYSALLAESGEQIPIPMNQMGHRYRAYAGAGLSGPTRDVKALEWLGSDADETSIRMANFRHWQGLSNEEKMAETQQWQDAYNTLMRLRVHQEYALGNEQTFDKDAEHDKITVFLASRGFVRGDATGDMLSPNPITIEK